MSDESFLEIKNENEYLKNELSVNTKIINELQEQIKVYEIYTPVSPRETLDNNIEMKRNITDLETKLKILEMSSSSEIESLK